MKKLFFLFGLLSFYFANAQDLPINDRWVNGFWDAHWITHPEAGAKEYGVYHFRKTIELKVKPEQFIVHVSADNRYKLYINGEEVSMGPARGDLEHWRFETLDITPQLEAGKNIIAATVWNYGIHAPAAQMTWRTAFILQGEGELEAIVNTDNSWKVLENKAYSPELESFRNLRSYIVVGPGDEVDGKLYPWGWKEKEFEDEDWQSSQQIRRGQTFGLGTDGHWRLVPRKIPLMDKFLLDLPEVREAKGITVPYGFVSRGQHLSVPPNSKVTLLLDQKQLVTAYPNFTFSSGKGSKIKISYSEALYDEEGNKGNRNEVEGKTMRGYSDIFYTDGGLNRTFCPLWLRTWRFMQLEIETQEQELFLEQINSYFTGYPFENVASFQADAEWLDDVWKVGWHTARLCAGETYYDCPYYEQLQYVGDTRIQALISLYVSGDDRLMRRAIDDFNESRVWNGLTQSRYPCEKLQIIPTYSLFWVSMIHDYWMHRNDEAYIRSLLPGVQSVLNWYAEQMNDTGLLGRTKWWNFVDWAKEWRWTPQRRAGGVPDETEIGNSIYLSLQYVYTLQQAEELHRALGEVYFADKYAKKREKLSKAIFGQGWDEKRQLLSDLPDSSIYSQHANIFGILTDVIPVEKQEAVMNRILTEEDLIQATFYFKFYLFQALVKTGMADKYLPQLQPWQDMLEVGLTTFAERPEPTRSDCHAWSASPNYDLLATVAGIRPAAPGFKKVRISPALGDLNEIKAQMPHPLGTISVGLERKGSAISGEINLPNGLSGTFEWNGKNIALKAGQNNIQLP